jgi:hypothetical protein
MLEIVYIVKFLVNICIGNKSPLVLLDAIDYYIGSYVGVMLVAKLCWSDAVRNILYFTFKIVEFFCHTFDTLVLLLLYFVHVIEITVS